MNPVGFFQISLPPELKMLPENVYGDVHNVFIATWHQLTSLISRVRKCQNLEDYYLLQEELGSYILQVDSEIGSAKVASYQAKKEINKIGNNADEKQYFLEKKNEVDLKRQLYLFIGKQYRTVGDAMVWRLYQYDAHLISSLGMNQSPGIISQSKGTGVLAEESEVRNY